MTPRKDVNLTQVNNLLMRHRAANELAPALSNAISTGGQGGLIPQAVR